MANLWSGRFEKDMDELMVSFNASIDFDKRFFEVDIQGSIAHITMLAEQKVVTEQEKDLIIEGLLSIKDKIFKGEVVFHHRLEDIHMTIESLLIEEIGETGKKLHTGRSRNDQIALDTRLYMKGEVNELIVIIKHLLEVLVNKAELYKSELMIGFTHLQHAQPVTIGFYLMAYFQMFKRDLERMEDALKRIDVNPLGAGALAGTTVPINRERTRELLGFASITENALDTVSDKDFVLEFLSHSAICMMHLSRFAEEFILWNSQEFGYIDIDDAYCTGSSIMPQMKNPDIAELLRGKTGRVYGDLMAMLTVMKGTPLAYNKDFQEDKEPLFDSLDTLKKCLVIFSKMLEHTTFKVDAIRKHMAKGFLGATDIAEHMVQKGIPFRQAHELVGKMVKYCEINEKQLEELTEEELKTVDHQITIQLIPDISPEACVNRRLSFGGTAIKEVERQIQVAKDFLCI